MSSQKCSHCLKVKRCQMFPVTKRWPGEPSVTYLCRPCARELGYTTTAKGDN